MGIPEAHLSEKPQTAPGATAGRKAEKPARPPSGGRSTRLSFLPVNHDQMNESR